MMTPVKGQKRQYAHQQSKVSQCQKLNSTGSKTNFISMSEAREIAEHIFPGIAWSG